MNTLPLPMKAIELIPHREPMLFVSELLKREGDEGVVRAELPGATVRKYPEILIEIIAQTVATCNGYDTQCAGKKMKAGMLVGVNECIFTTNPIEGDNFIARAQFDFGFGALRIASGEVYSGDEILPEKMLVSCRLKVWEEEDESV